MLLHVVPPTTHSVADFIAIWCESCPFMSSSSDTYLSRVSFWGLMTNIFARACSSYSLYGLTFIDYEMSLGLNTTCGDDPEFYNIRSMLVYDCVMTMVPVAWVIYYGMVGRSVICTCSTPKCGGCGGRCGCKCSSNSNSECCV